MDGSSARGLVDMIFGLFVKVDTGFEKLDEGHKVSQSVICVGEQRAYISPASI
jgi:hypothetical protein